MSAIEELREVQLHIEACAYNKALDDLVSEMRKEYFHRVGTQFDNAILEMEKVSDRLKKPLIITE